MSETLSPSRAFAPPLFRPQMMIGAVTPLWGYFTGAAMTGMAMWWMSRWMPAAKAQAVVVTAPEPVLAAPAEAVAAPPALVIAAEPVAVEPEPVVAEPSVTALEPVELDPMALAAATDPPPAVEPSQEVKLLAAPAAPRSRKAKDAEPKPD